MKEQIGLTEIADPGWTIVNGQPVKVSRIQDGSDEYFLTELVPEYEPQQCSPERGHFKRPDGKECYCGALRFEGNAVSLRKRGDP